MKRKYYAILLVLLLMLVSACAPAQRADGSTGGETSAPAETGGQEQPQKTKVNFAVLSGPTGIGAAKLISDNEAGLTANEYAVTVASAPDELTAKLMNGEVDIAALPTNTAANLYNKSGGAIEIIALTNLGVLYILENGNTVNSMEDLMDKTLYATGRSANPEYVLNFLLRENGMEPGLDVEIEYLPAEEVAAMMVSGKAELAMLPVPAATSVLLKNGAVRKALDLTAEWEKAGAEGVLTMSCVVVRREFAGQNPEAVRDFLEELEASILYMTENVKEGAKLVVPLGIVGNEAIAEAAIPDCNMKFISGGAVREHIEPYYKVLFAADPASIGGKLPDDSFYYVP